MENSLEASFLEKHDVYVSDLEWKERKEENQSTNEDDWKINATQGMTCLFLFLSPKELPHNIHEKQQV